MTPEQKMAQLRELAAANPGGGYEALYRYMFNRTLSPKQAKNVSADTAYSENASAAAGKTQYEGMGWRWQAEFADGVSLLIAE